MTKALLVKATGEVTQLDLPKDDAYEVIKEAVGGWIDSARTDEVVAYVHDEGLLIGLRVNAVCSLLFGRPLVGDIVLVGQLNEYGESDGYDHDLPEAYLSEKFLGLAHDMNSDETVVDSLTKTVSEMDLTPKMFSLTDDEMTEYFETGEIPESSIERENNNGDRS